ncbi:hypothetical protein O181_092328 [Austropuccinia psidii MF-1]|uniref:Eukaryotic translation initiation factor 3 subunit H n=1 Tax=Austropuccinia psidii MF-1 TaxID=1389203 RepID=A0A9Q3IZ23_9BASI|nr:hypothetical protein [Austropuccinia psidii MF-1]
MSSAKPLTAAAAIMVASNSRTNSSSPAPTQTTKLHGNSVPQLTELEHEIPVESIKVDSLAVMKIVKHARETVASGSTLAASGQLLGLDTAGVLNVSDAFPLPSGSLNASSEGDEGRGNQNSTARYTASILPRLSALGSDANVVGFYCSTMNGQHLATPGFIETLISMQIGPIPVASKPSSGLLTSKSKFGGKGLALVYDLTSSSEGTIQLKAYKLSKEFVDTYKTGKFDSQNLADHKLTSSNFLQEIPLTIQSSALLTAFLATLIAPSPNSNLANTVSNTENSSKLIDFVPSFSPLGLPSSSHTDSPMPLSESLSATIASIEVHNTALSTLSFQSRQLARDRAKLEPVIAKRKADNEIRAQQGLPPLPPSSEEAALQEPSRLETMCALSGIDGAAKKLTETSGLGLIRTFGSKVGV